MKIRLVCSLPALERDELAVAVEAFSEVLYGSVPAERLNDCYLYAVKHRDSTFPLAVTEIIHAWRAILAEEVARRPQPCFLCDGSGYATIRDPNDHDKDIVKECPNCFGKAQTAIAKSAAN